jgi:pimeloyl-ACP methyl ester carboxylesterase
MQRFLPAFFVLFIVSSLAAPTACPGPNRPDYPSNEWFPCSLYEGANDNRAECYAMDVPLFWDKSDGKKITVYAKRLPVQGESDGMLWLLHGGPGASGVYLFPRMMERLQALYPNLTMYTIDHRGVGYSTPLYCPIAENPYTPGRDSIAPAEYEKCITYVNEKYGSDLAGFSITNAAYDVQKFIEITRQSGKKSLIWGGSYGTALAERYLQIFPNEVDGVILEGIVNPTDSLIRQDEYNEKIGRIVLDRCGQDTFCAAKFTKAPLQTLIDLEAKLDTKEHCSQLRLSSSALKSILSVLLYYHPLNTLVPSLIYRLDRCSDADAQAISQFYNVLFAPGEGDLAMDNESFSEVLFFNIAWSELWKNEEFSDEAAMRSYLTDVTAENYINAGNGWLRLEDYLLWPKYEDSTYDNKWAETTTPMLMLQGMIDPSTPYDMARDLENHFNGPHQTFVAFPNAPHNVTGGGSAVSTDPQELTCGLQLFLDFLKNPLQELDTSCVTKTLPLNFQGNSTLSEYYYGTTDLWEN